MVDLTRTTSEFTALLEISGRALAPQWRFWLRKLTNVALKSRRFELSLQDRSDRRLLGDDLLQRDVPEAGGSLGTLLSQLQVEVLKQPVERAFLLSNLARKLVERDGFELLRAPSKVALVGFENRQA